MNKNIEEIIKEALENHDSGYVSGAWESMQARLDGTPSTPFYKKWWVAAAFGTALVGSATYFMLNNSSDKGTTQQTAVVQNVNDSDKEAVKTTNNAKNDISTTGASEAPVENQKIPANLHENKVYSDFGYPNKLNGSMNSNHSNNSNPDLSHITTTPPIYISNPNGSLQYNKLNLPKSICLGEEMAIVNTNELLNIVVIEPSGRKMVVAGGKTAYINTAETGTIRIISGTTEELIAIQENKSDLYIDVDASLLFENGIPSVKFKVPGETNLNWSSDVKGTEMKGDSYIVHPYTQKEITVSVSSTNEFGCTTTEKQTISINEPYNLLAAKGLNTNSPDVRNRTFMPYALTQRTNVSFELIIIDPRNGAIVYSTSDANEAWDGIDKRTGEMVKLNTVWPWRVLMKNPNPGEPKEYSGTITIL